MMLKCVFVVAVLSAGVLFGAGQLLLAIAVSTLALVTQITICFRRGRIVSELDSTGNKPALLLSEAAAMERFRSVADGLRTIEWDRDLSQQINRPLEEHPLMKELAHPAELRKFSTVELFQRVLTIIAGFTRAQAAGIVFREGSGSGVVAYGVAGRRFEQHLRALATEYWKGNKSLLGVHDSFSQNAIWGGAGSFGHRFAHVVALSLDDSGSEALVWLGYSHGSKPSPAECEAAIQLLGSVSGALRSTKRLAVLGARADSAETEKAQASQMLAHVSHDIRTPLSNVKAILHLFGTDGGVSVKEAQELCGVALQNCEELGELVGDVIDFTRARDGQLVRRLQALDLESVCRKVVSSLSVAARQRELILSLQSSGPVWVKGDVGHLKRAITNLISNALKYTPKGEVRVRVEASAASQRRVRVIIQDTGLGMNEAQLKRLFTPFTRFHEAQADGIGLGLAITKLFVEEHGGKVSVTSAPNVGTTFVMELPTIEATQARSELSSAVEGEAPRVLVVDDDIDLGRSLAKLLEQSGCHVQCVTNVKAAESAIGAQGFDAVVSDLSMPGGGGRAVIDSVNRLSSGAIPVFIVSGDFDARLVKELKAAGAEDVFEKPIEHKILLEAIRNGIISRALRSAAAGG